MKFDVGYIIQLMMVLTISASFYLWVKYRFQAGKKRAENIILNLVGKITLAFSKKFTAYDLKSYEKIEIWRYCSLF